MVYLSYFLYCYAICKSHITSYLKITHYTNYSNNYYSKKLINIIISCSLIHYIHKQQ